MRLGRDSLFSLLCLLANLQDAFGKKQTVLEVDDPWKFENDTKHVIPDTSEATFGDIKYVNERISPLLKDLTEKSDYMRFYRLNLFNKECKYKMDDNVFCGSNACNVVITEESSVPEIWSSKSLGKLEGFMPELSRQIVESDQSVMENVDKISQSCLLERLDDQDRQYCYVDNELDSGCVYISLLDNPERFTGYAAPHATRIWEMIYNECLPDESEPTIDFPSLFLQGSLAPPPHSQEKIWNERMDMWSIEQRVFYRVLSGMHSSISTHLCYNYLNQSTGVWGPNLNCFMEKVLSHPERLENLYFAYSLLLRAMDKMNGHLDTLTFCHDSALQDTEVRHKIRDLVEMVDRHPRYFDESVLFTGEPVLSSAMKKEFREHFRTVSALMDCVGCERCRLWGKIQTNGFGTALKILFEVPDVENEIDQFETTSTPLQLRRSEIVALVNTFDRLSRSINYIQKFHELYVGQHQPESRSRKVLNSVKHFVSQHVPVVFHPFLKKVCWVARIFYHDFWMEFRVVLEGFRYVLSSYLQLPNDIFLADGCLKRRPIVVRMKHDLDVLFWEHNDELRKTLSFIQGWIR
ncbi:ER oxidoreductin Ero1b [Schizosaccharomyces cryophilus OY26]|uniref:ER oxidoreductin Ero1b n=1 Tax=Schizosaccharomyces cryophilus (strain OY26 / ATCC MYA-4695 / CBS 11777 / NBRC 106824 / NRRL Y48691) TaxID=653667 RepID=S9W1W4_SCHCR|nr:ER oxidoreductin Ero1b [Schizosaccharomyces cryophilus OY26]EPY52020.1 ER oxidoreductin Ero1b [Schizosaccharomyces cryophilus OY26]